MGELPPEDQPDTVSVGPIRGIPVLHEDDPRFADERIAWSRATAVAQALHSPEELLGGLGSENWMVRHESIDRLIARARSDARTLPALLDAAGRDPAWQVREAILIRLHEFPGDGTVAVLRHGLDDDHPGVRWSAGFSLVQLGFDPGPGWSRDG